jgi:hypothetical protein
VESELIAAPLIAVLVVMLIHIALGAWKAHTRRWFPETPARNPVMPSTDWRDEEADCAPEMPTLPDPVALLFAECGYSREVE